MSLGGRKNLPSAYNDPSWPETPNRILAPYAAALIRDFENNFQDRGGSFMMKSHTDWKMEELLNQEQRNFSGHLAIIFCYLQEKGLSVDDFVEYTGAKVSSRWKSAATNLQDIMNAILFNVLSNGEKVLNVNIGENDAVATVTGLFKSDVMRYYGCIPEIHDRFWNKFKLIAGEVGFSFSWEKTEEGYY